MIAFDGNNVTHLFVLESRSRRTRISFAPNGMKRSRRISRSDSVSSAASSSVPIATLDSPVPESAAFNGGVAVGGAFPPQDDDGISEEVRTAIAALGIMRRGASSTGTTSSTSAVTHQNGNAVAGSGHHLPVDGRPESGSRSASTASSASIYSWSQQSGQVTDDSTAASSPLIPGSEQGDGDEIDATAMASSQAVADPKFISRVSQLPVISGGLEWYGKAKDSSRVVKVR